MADQQVVYQVGKIEGETGENWKKRKDFETSAWGIKLDGYPEGLGQALVKLGAIPIRYDRDIPGEIDNVLRSLQSGENVNLRRNVAGQQVPARWYERFEDRKDVVAGLADYFGLIADPIIGFLRGYYSDSVGEAEGIIRGINELYPITPEMTREFLYHKYGLIKKKIEDAEKTKGTVGTALSPEQQEDINKIKGMYNLFEKYIKETGEYTMKDGVLEEKSSLARQKNLAAELTRYSTLLSSTDWPKEAKVAFLYEARDNITNGLQEEHPYLAERLKVEEGKLNIKPEKKAQDK